LEKGIGKKKKNAAEDPGSGKGGKNDSSQPPGGFSSMSRRFSQGKLKGEERQSIIQEIQRQAKAAALAALKPVFTAFLEAEVTAKLGRGKREARRISGQAREIDWQCASCGSRDANQFMRDGHYRRDLETGWGHLEDVQVPMLECQNCGHDVICHFAIMEKFRRFWVDFEQDVVFGSGLCESLRHLSQRWSALVGGSVGLRTINERINQIGQLRGKFRQAVTFGSRKGAEVAIYLQVQRLHAHWREESWWETSHDLYFALWNLNP